MRINSSSVCCDFIGRNNVAKVVKIIPIKRSIIKFFDPFETWNGAVSLRVFHCSVVVFCMILLSA